MRHKEIEHKLYTKWGKALIESSGTVRPHSEYPRPQLRRESYQCLNGLWEYAIREDTADSEETPLKPDGEILVPFSPESLLSGVSRQLLPSQALYYRRTVSFDVCGWSRESGKRLLLHFGAVDQDCTVFVNGREVGSHSGGYWPFSFDITEAAKDGDNEILVACTDPSNTGQGAYGKQKLKRGGIWYTAQSGIWQTVWAEAVNTPYIESLMITPLYDESAVKFEITIMEADCNRTVSRRTELPGFRKWTPDDPFLYTVNIDLISGQGPLISVEPQPSPEPQPSTEPQPSPEPQPSIEPQPSPEPQPSIEPMSLRPPSRNPHSSTAEEFPVNSTDHIESYFGMRKFGIAADDDGIPRLLLNDEPIFHNGLLDQGYWSDGLYTPPSDEAMVFELTRIKELGFNMLRKHIKIEPLRWYYHCDRLGILVWQDFVSGGGPYHPMVTQILPFIGVKLNDRNYKLFGRSDTDGRAAYSRELKDTIDLLYNAVSIAVWVPFNEGWGQFDASDICAAVRNLDATRTIDHASGWHDRGAGDLDSRHIYYRRFRLTPDPHGRVQALTEFGGYSFAAGGHCSTEKAFGYRMYKSPEELAAAVEKLYNGEVIPAMKQGLSAAVYTQVSDVEDEVNGLFTYDREILKISEKTLRRVNNKIKLIYRI